MSEKTEQFELIDEISEEGVDFHSLQAEDEDEENILDNVEDPKVQESLNSVSTDDSVRIYLQQIGKIPLLSADEELDVAKKISEGLARNAIAGRVNGKMCQLSSQVNDNDMVEIITLKDKEGMEVFRHSTAHILAQTVIR